MVFLPSSILCKLAITNTLVFQIGEDFNQDRLVVSGPYLSFSYGVPTLVLVEKVVR